MDVYASHRSHRATRIHASAVDGRRKHVPDVTKMNHALGPLDSKSRKSLVRVACTDYLGTTLTYRPVRDHGNPRDGRRRQAHWPATIVGHESHDVCLQHEKCIGQSAQRALKQLVYTGLSSGPD